VVKIIAKGEDEELVRFESAIEIKNNILVGGELASFSNAS